MDGYDAIVIGAGNAGLTASATMAQKGMKVLCLERHNIPGGSATSFCRGRFEFEIALHQLSGVGVPEKPGPLRMMLNTLGVLDDIEFIEMKDLYNIIMPDGFRVTLKADKSQVITELKEKFPNEKEGIDKFFDLAYGYANQMLGAFFFKDPDISRDKYPLLYSYAFKSCTEVLDECFSDPLLKSVMSVYWGYLGLPPERLSFAYLAMLFFVYIEFKPFHVKGGSQAMSNAIANRFQELGGEIRFNCGVKKIVVENGEVKGVVTQDGDHIPAKAIISNASQVVTYVDLIDSDQVPDSVGLEMRGRSLSPSAFSMFLGFDCEPQEMGITESTNFIMTDINFDDSILDKMHSLSIDDDLLVLSCFDVPDPNFSAPGTCQANVVTLRYGEPWLRIPPTKYADVKYRCAEGMMRILETAYPNLRSHIEECEVATPLTHMRYLGTPAGSIYGFEHYTKDSMFFQPSRRSPIKGLYFAGGWVGDAGFQTTLQSGVSAAKTVARDLG
jgi:phytoene dehydrogenase-like protein